MWPVISYQIILDLKVRISDLLTSTLPNALIP